ncbi:hypothetical protein PTKU46_74700 [Paraburkholderia terrae]|uniref:hypothetical protein n=1 Tax=Paraburkholderia terrae TaxID=311230 RepID=UPI0030E4743D
MYSKEMFAAELDMFLAGKVIECQAIAKWAYNVRLENLSSIDSEVSRWLLQLGAMDMGEEFEWSREELAALVSTARAG